MQQTFNDQDTPYEAERWPGYWSSVRLEHLNEVARRLWQIGATDIKVVPERLMVTFGDPKIRGSAELEIVPWYDGAPGWFWYADIRLPDGFGMGPLRELRRRRSILYCPYPRMVVKSYLAETWWERRPVPVKRPR